MRLKARMGPRGQIVVPKPIRDALRIRSGDAVYFDIEDDHATLKPDDPDETLGQFLSAYPKQRFPDDFQWTSTWDARYEERGRRKGLL